MAGGDDDPGARALMWIEYIGAPMKTEMEGIKRAFWWGYGGCIGAGVVLGLLAPFILKKLGLSG